MNATLEKTNEMVDHLTAVNRILEKYNYNKNRLITILQEVQDEYRYLSKDIISYVATSLQLPPARVFGVATFYTHFALEPKGKYVIKLCDGTACHVKGSIKILDALRDHLNLTEEKNTTPDQLFTIETVSCLGACGLAPVMLVNEDVYGQVKPEQAVKIIDEIMEEENALEAVNE